MALSQLNMHGKFYLDQNNRVMIVELSTGLVIDVDQIIAIKPIEGKGSEIICKHNVKIPCPLSPHSIYREIELEAILQSDLYYDS